MGNGVVVEEYIENKVFVWGGELGGKFVWGIVFMYLLSILLILDYYVVCGLVCLIFFVVVFLWVV